MRMALERVMARSGSWGWCGQGGGLLLALALALLLSGCAQAPLEETAPVDVGPSAQQSHAEQLAALAHWQVSGRMAVQADGEGYHGRFDWTQDGERMQLGVSGPFSQGSVRLLSDGEFFELRDGKGGSARAASADELLFKATGLRVPVAGLRYWMLGLPAPGDVQQPLYDERGRLQSLTQHGWKIRYRAYMADDVDAVSLPRKLFLDRQGLEGQLRVRLVVERWHT